MVPGARGGAAQNYYCTDRTDCRAGFNLVFVLVDAQRIGKVEDDTYRMYARAR